jgi:hypothetical protein
MEREKFEDKFKSTFDHAEVTPSENVWTNLELELAKAEGVQMKRRLVFFKMLAAASVVFALAAGAMSLYLITDRNQLTSSPNAQAGLVQPLVRKQPQDAGQTNQADNNVDKSDLHKNEIPSTNEQITDDRNILQKESGQVANARPRPGTSADNRLVVAHEDATDNANLANHSAGSAIAPEADKLATLNDKSLEPLRLNREIKLALPGAETHSDPVEAMMARLAQREAQLSNETSKKSTNKSKEEKLWTSLGFAAGSFNTISSGTSLSSPSQPATLASNTSIADQEAKASGFAYTMGVNMGTRVSNRWVVQGGVNYLMQTSDYTAQAAIGSSDFTSFRPASINELEKLNHADGQSTSRVVTTAPYNVNNNVRYLSLPIQAGYLVVDKKVGVQLNAGISTDLFLHNNKTAESDNIDQISQGFSDDSPYRSMNFSGLVGTELSYRFGSRYRVALNPGLRYPLSSVYKSNLGIQSTPLTFDVGLRFRYIFH